MIERKASLPASDMGMIALALESVKARHPRVYEAIIEYFTDPAHNSLTMHAQNGLITKVRIEKYY